MFERWASDVLATYLGQFLEIQREQLRISLWSAWQTGLTLENVPLRADAFDHLNLPIRLQEGSICRVAVQVPWRALRSPVVLDFEGVVLRFRLLGPEDLTPDVAEQRAEAAKQALIAAEELKELASKVADTEGGNQSSETTQQGGILWTLMNRAVTLFLRRLQLSVRNVHLLFEDGSRGRSFGVRLQSLYTCEASSGSPDHQPFGLRDNASSPDAVSSPLTAKEPLEKHFAFQSLRAYWRIKGHHDPGKGSESMHGENEEAWDVLQSTDVLLRVGARLGSRAADGTSTSVHVVLAVKTVPLKLRFTQAADVLRCIDEVQWTMARMPHAHLRPFGGERSSKNLWRYALNAVLAEIRGPLRAAPWRPSAEVYHARRRSVLLYRKRLELERERKKSQQPSIATINAEQITGKGGAVLSPAERGRSGLVLSDVGEEQLAALEQQLSVSDVLLCRAAARHTVEGPPGAIADEEGPGSKQRRGVFWGLAKVASMIGYLPRGRDAQAALPQPTESEVQELYEAVNFDPSDEESRMDVAAAGQNGSTQTKFQVIVECPATDIRISLLSAGGSPEASLDLLGLHTDVRVDDSGVVAKVTLEEVRGDDWVSGGRGTYTQFLGRGPQSVAQEKEDCAGELLAPVFRAQYLRAHSRLDILVEPLRLRTTVTLLKSLASFAVPSIKGSYAAACMESLNRLPPEAQAVIKATMIRGLGPPLDLAAKVSLIEMLIVEDGQGSASASDAFLLRSGEVLLRTVGLEESAAAFKELIKLTNRAVDFNGQRDTCAGLALVEDRLGYDNIELSVSGIEIHRMPGSAVCFPSITMSPIACVLQPIRVGGAVKLHRMAEDYSSPQMHLSLSLGSIIARVDPDSLELFGKIFKSGNRGVESPSSSVAEDVHSTAPPRSLSSGPLYTSIDLRISSIDAVCVTTEPLLPLIFFGCQKGSVVLKLFEADTGVVLNASGLQLVNNCPSSETATGGLHVSPSLNKVLDSVLFMGPKAVSVEGLHVSLMPPTVPSEQPRVLDLQLVDLAIKGRPGEAGMYATRLNDREPTHISLRRVSDDLASNHTEVNVANFAIGHAFIMRMAVLVEKFTAEAKDAAGEPRPFVTVASVSNIVETISIEAHDCQLTWKYHAETIKGGRIPGSILDFLLLHEDVATLDIQLLSLCLPLDSICGPPASRQILVISGVYLRLATIGYPARPSLPVVQLPLLTVRSKQSKDGGILCFSVDVPSLDLGLHPSHLLIASVAILLYQTELASIRTAVELREYSMTLEMMDTDQEEDTVARQRLEISLGCLGVSITGSTPSSVCLKAQGHRLEAVMEISPRAVPDVSLRWDYLTFHVLQPKEDELLMESTPFVGGLGPHSAADSHHDAAIFLTPVGGSGTIESVTNGPPRSVRRSLSGGLGLGLAGMTGPPPDSMTNPGSMPYMVARFAASSAVSRYFSAPDSEFEDAASELLPEGVLRTSPLEGRSPRQAPLFPLDITSREYDVEILVHVFCGASILSATGAADGDGPSSQNFQARWGTDKSVEVSIAAIGTRLYLGKWHLATECAWTYHTFAQRARGYFQEKHSDGTGNGCMESAVTESTAPSEASQPRLEDTRAVLKAALAARNAALDVGVHATGLAFEVLDCVAKQGEPQQASVDEATNNESADGDGDQSQIRMVPLAQLLVRSVGMKVAHGHDTSKFCFTLPSLLLSVGAMQVQPLLLHNTSHGIRSEIVVLPAKDAVFGLHELEINSSVDIFTLETEDDGQTSSELRSLTALVVSLQQGSFWINQQSSSIGLLLARRLGQTTKAAKTAWSADSASAEVSLHQQSRPLTGIGLDLATNHTVVSIDIECLAAVLHDPLHCSNDVSDQQKNSTTLLPLFEAAMTKIAVQAADRGAGELAGTAAVRWQMDVYNPVKLCWETVVDPWTVGCRFAVPVNSGIDMTRSAFHSAVPWGHLRLAIESSHCVEMTVTAATINAAARAQALLSSVIESGPDGTVTSISQALAGDTESGDAPFVLLNCTGSRMEVWLAEPGPGNSVSLCPPIGPPSITVDSQMDSAIALPGTLLSDADGGGRYAGNPSPSAGVVHSTSASPEMLYTTDEVLRRPQLTLLYFRLDGSGPLAGPIHLNKTQATSWLMKSPGPTETPSFHVIAETRERGNGLFETVLHSGVQVFNATPVSIQLGGQHPSEPTTSDHSDLEGPLVLGILAPGARMWLPAEAWTGWTGESPGVAVLRVRPYETYQSSFQHATPGQKRSGTEGGGILISRLPSAQVGTPSVLMDSSNVSAAACSSFTYQWSAGVQIDHLVGLPSTSQASQYAVQRLICPRIGASDTPPLRLSLGAVKTGNNVSVLTLAPPVTLHNALPVPVDVTLGPRWGAAARLHLRPNERLPLLHLDSSSVDTIAIRPEGFEPSTPPLRLPAPTIPTVNSEKSPCYSIEEDAYVGGIAIGRAKTWSGPSVATSLQELGPGRSHVDVTVQRTLYMETGASMIRFYCHLWVYNCTGMPLSLRNSSLEDLHRETSPEDGMLATEAQTPEDDVPDSWIAPFRMVRRDQKPHFAGENMDHPTSTTRTWGPPFDSPCMMDGSRIRGEDDTAVVFGGKPGPSVPLSARARSTASVYSVARSVSADFPGLGEILNDAIRTVGPTPAPTPRTRPGSSLGSEDVLDPLGVPVSGRRGSASSLPFGLNRAEASVGRGIADSMEKAPTFARPSPWPSMAFTGIDGGSGQLRLQLRATPTRAPMGRTFWSSAVEVAVGGASAAATALPVQSSSPSGATGGSSTGSYPVLVTASAVPHAGGAVALCITPRYLLQNLLDVPIQYRQQGAGSGGERSLSPGSTCAVRWTDAALAPRLCVRIQEAGWMWSGGFLLDVPGDLFVKIRHRDRGVTMLVRVDVATSSWGTTRVTLSHNPAGFAPYRVENCSLETINARQKSVREQQDVLRPYCALNYAWDEPTQPHQLVLELPGARVLGTFDLDKVGQDVMLPVRSRRYSREPDTWLRVVVRAEGPTRVLTVLDQKRHMLESPVGQTLARALDIDTGLLWEVSLDLAAAGVSLIGHVQREVAYLRLTGLVSTAAVGAARQSFSLQVRAIQLDNPSPWVAYPVALILPAPASKLTSTMAAAVEIQPAPALVARLAVWRRRPAGVICIELVELQARSIGVYLDQQHVEEMMAVINELTLRPSPISSGNDLSLPPNKIVSGVEYHSALRGARTLRLPSYGRDVPTAPLDVPLLPPLQDLLALHTVTSEPATGHAPPAPDFWRQKVYIDTLSVAPLQVTLSFLSSPVHHPAILHPRLAAIQRMLSLADVEDAQLWLAGLRLSNPLMDATALSQSLQRHYLRALVPELYKIVGAASVIGDPVALLHHLGLGVWVFLSAPAAGLVESARQRGPRQFLFGVLSGTRGLVLNVIYAVSNAATKAAGAARKAIVVWGLDRREVPLGAGSFRRRIIFVEERAFEQIHGSRKARRGEGGLLAAVLRGLVGLVSEPIQGAEESGLAGLVRGLQRGALGAVALPLATLLEMSARTADSVRRAVAGTSNLGWVRPPRCVSTSQPLGPYDWSEAMGRWLLREIERFERDDAVSTSEGVSVESSAGSLPSAETFVLCVPAVTDGEQSPQQCYLIMTSQRVLHVRAKGPMWEPDVRWEAAVVDVQSVALVPEQPNKVRFVATPPPKRVFGYSLGMRLGAPRQVVERPLSFLSAVICEGGEAAQRVVDVARRVVTKVGPRASQAGFGFVISSSG